MVKAIIFDCDGTLVDSEAAHFLSWQRALQDLGEELTVEEALSFVGRPAIISALYLAEKIGSDCADELVKGKHAHFEALQEAGHPAIQPTMDFLHRLAGERKVWGYKIGLASAAPRNEILSNLRQHNIEKFFDVILSGKDDLNAHYSDPEGVNKPKPYVYLHAAKLLNLDPSECVVIEDSRPGVTAGVAAGCFTIAVPNNQTQHHDLSCAHLILPSFSEMSVEAFLKLVRSKASPA